ncbi:MAG: hypothetical protein GX121_01085 [Ignavibacteria bacterium]|nr:hypothetical protein [Ignavibacteria bacterium]
MNMDEKYIGYLKYSGKSVEDGFLDIRKSAEALLGFDVILRYFLLKEDPSLSKIEFEIPIRIRKGSWEALIPKTIEAWILTGGGLAATTYLTALAKKAATDGFFETGIAKDIKKTFQNAIIAIQWIIKIAKHIGSFVNHKFENLKVEKESNKLYVLIPNKKNKLIKVQKKYYDLFINCPGSLFSKNANIIENDRILKFGVFKNGVKRIVTISENEKQIFYNNDENNDIVLPELIHGQFVELEGEITRATENTNTIGFRYKDHILVCKPKYGIIAKFKESIISNDNNHFFPKVLLKGQVDRTNKNGDFKEKKPQILFFEIIPLKSENQNANTFLT